MIGTNIRQSAIRHMQKLENGGFIGVKLVVKQKPEKKWSTMETYYCFPGVHPDTDLGKEITKKFDFHIDCSHIGTMWLQ